MTRYAIGQYQAGAKDSIAIHGRPDFTAFFESNAAQNRWRSIRFVLALLLIALAILALWELLVRQSNRPEIFSCLIGGLVLLGVAACLQDARDIVVFVRARRAGGKIKGTLTERFFYARTAVELYGFAALYCLVFLATLSWFFLGGAITCFISARRRRDWAMISR